MSDLDYFGAMLAFFMGLVNGVFAMFTGSVTFGLIGLGFGAIGWMLALRM